MKLIWSLINGIFLISTFVYQHDNKTKSASSQKVIYSLAKDQIENTLYSSYSMGRAQYHPKLAALIKSSIKDWDTINDHSQLLHLLRSHLDSVYVLNPQPDLVRHQLNSYDRWAKFLQIEEETDQYIQLTQLVNFIPDLFVRGPYCNLSVPKLQLLQDEILILKPNRTYYFNFNIFGSRSMERLHGLNSHIDTVEIETGPYTPELSEHVVKYKVKNKITGMIQTISNVYYIQLEKE